MGAELLALRPFRIKAVEDRCQLVLGNPGSLILDGHEDRPALAPRAEPDLATRRAERDGIGNDIAKDLRQPGLDAGHDELAAPLAEIHQATRAADAPHLVLELPERGRELIVPGIESRLSQVFRNVIANAASFSPAGGEIRLRARHDGRAVLVTVEDQGPGVPEDKLTAIFDRFYSERPAGEKFGTHSGLGLSISKQIVEAHRGMIWAENRREIDGTVGGARFCIRLPSRP